MQATAPYFFMGGSVPNRLVTPGAARGPAFSVAPLPQKDLPGAWLPEAQAYAPILEQGYGSPEKPCGKGPGPMDRPGAVPFPSKKSYRDGVPPPRRGELPFARVAEVGRRGLVRMNYDGRFFPRKPKSASPKSPVPKSNTEPGRGTGAASTWKTVTVSSIVT